MDGAAAVARGDMTPSIARNVLPAILVIGDRGSARRPAFGPAEAGRGLRSPLAFVTARFGFLRGLASSAQSRLVNCLTFSIMLRSEAGSAFVPDRNDVCLANA